MTPRTVIAVTGIDGCGKTTFAGRLHAALTEHGIPALVLHVDDFRRPVRWIRDNRDEATTYLEDYYDFASIEACLAAFRAGAARCERPVYDERGDREAGVTEVGLADVAAIILEGVFTMRLPSSSAHYRVFLAASYEAARRRIIERGTPPWRSRAEFEHRISRRYFPAQQRYLAEVRPERDADVLVDNDDPTCPRLLRADVSRLPPALRRPLVSVLP